MFFMALSGFATGALAYYIKPVLDHIFIARQARLLALLPLGVIGIYAVKGLADYLQSVLLAQIEEQVLMQLRETLHDQTLQLPLATLLSQSHGSTLSRMSLDLTLLQQSITVLARFFLSGFQILALIGVVFYMSWELALISLGTLPLAFYPLIRFGQKLRRRGHEQQEQMGDILSQFSESLHGVEVIKTHGAEAFEAQRFRKMAWQYYTLMMRIVRVQKANTPVMEMIAALGIAAIIYLGGQEVVSGQMSTGAFFSFLTALGMIYEPLRQLSSANSQLQQGLSAADRLFDWLDQPMENPEASRDGEPPCWGEWSCRGLTLEFGGETILDHLDLTIPEGSMTAITGASGSGKTTLVRAILGLLPPSSGEIRISGQSVVGMPLSRYRKNFAFVAQDPVLFSGTALENIAYGDPDPDLPRAEAVARAAYCWEFLANTGGLESPVAGHGSNLSGGQRQRMAIARALYLDRPVLVLDEATSSLDTASEERIAEVLEKLRGWKTLILVAHRPRTIALADQRIHLDHGHRVLPGGSPDSSRAKSSW